MRLRETKAPLQSGAAKVWAKNTQPNPDAYYEYPDATYYWTPEYECIKDSPRKEWMSYGRHARFLRMRGVDHKSFKILLNEAPFTVQADAYWSWGGSAPARLSQYTYGADLAWNLFNAGMVNRPSPSTGHYDRWQATKPSVGTRLNLAVSLLELADIKKMVDVIPPKHLMYKNKRARDWREAFSWLQYGNGLHLNYNFGWKPFVNDCVNLVDTATRFSERLNKLQNQANQTLRRTFVDDSQAISAEWLINAPSAFPGEKIKYVFVGSAKRASTFHYTYDLPEYGETEMRVRAWGDALGLHPDVATFWQIVPYSFVVDWAWNVTGYLEQFRNDWVAPWVTWHQCCYSQKYTGVLDAFVGLLTTGGLQYYHVGTCNLKEYIRYVGPPVFSGKTDDLNADKIRLGSSLLFGLFR